MRAIMDKLFGSQIACGNTAYKRAKNDFYPTPPEVTQSLMDFLGLCEDTVIWEPACGDGDMVRTLEQYGHKVIGTDIKTGTDFLTANKPQNVSFIITNPPFSPAKEFIEKGAELGVPFAYLLKSQFWHARSRYDLFQKIPPAYILPLTWRPDFLFKERDRNHGAPLMDVMWCVWLTEKSSTIYCPLTKPVNTNR